MENNTVYAVAAADGGIVAEVIETVRYFITVVSADDTVLDRVFFNDAAKAINFAKATVS